MADEAEKPEEGLEGEPTEKKSKKGIFMLGGMLGLVGVAYFGATMGTPSIDPIPQFQGPYVAPLTPEKGNMQVNLADTDKNTYLLMGLTAEFDAYDGGYLEGQLADPVFSAKLLDRILTLGATETRESLASQDQVEAFLLQLRNALDPICFPVHLGDASLPNDPDSASGLRPGDSHLLGTLRGRYHDHTLAIDATKQTMRLDEGEEVGYAGHEIDLLVSNAEQNYIYVNVTELKPDFVGELKLGVKGRLRKVLRHFWVQQ